MASTPALPWGVNAAVAADGGAPKRDRADDPAEDESARAEKQRKLEEAAARDVSALAAVGLKEGARVEVLWEVETGGDTGGGALTAHVRSILLRAFSSTPCVCTRLSGGGDAGGVRCSGGGAWSLGSPAPPCTMRTAPASGR
jgi:hypothetical protein